MAALFVFALFSALVDVFAAQRLQHLDPGSVAAVAFTLTGVFFCGLTLLRTRPARVLAVARAHAADLLVLNVTTAVTWLSLLYALKLMEPAVANVVSIAIGPACTVLLQYLWWRKGRVLPGELLSALGIVLALAGLVWASLDGRSGVGDRAAAVMALGVCAAVASGAGGAANVVFSARLGAAGVDVPTVMGLRFGLVAAAGWLLAATGDTARLGEALLPGAVVAVIGVGIPAVLVQIGVRRVTPVTASMICALAPALTLLLQLADKRLTFSVPSAVGIAVITVLIGLGLLARRGAPPAAVAQEGKKIHALPGS
ncbi:EamA family transporter [Streptomyces sp. NPDC050315]|uniref:EamA family transporter n=1 Tax=Streptomyces sp. NPDC050315 TaxID=3155039 RepID=UPI00341201A6